MKKYLSMFIAMILISGCEKTDEGHNEKLVIAGITNNSGIHVIANPPIIIEDEGEEYDNGSYSGIVKSDMDSIDINQDNKYDFNFSYYFKSSFPNDCDTTILDGCESSGEERTYIQIRNNYQIAFNYLDEFFCGVMPKSFALNDTISTYSNWSNTQSWLTLSCDQITYWEAEPSPRYLGVRMIAEDTLYGWIKFNYHPGKIQIDEYYFEK